MPVLRHKGTGVLATVSDERARSLSGSDWVSVEAEKPKRKPETRSRRAKSDDE